MTCMRVAIPLLIVVSVLVAGCGGEDEAAAPRPAPAPRDGRLAGDAAPLGRRRLPARRGVAAVLRRPTEAYRSPGGQTFARFGLRNENGVPSTFRVLRTLLGADCRPDWYRVQLPVRPNGTRGWIPASAARRYVVDYRIVVDLSDRVVTVFKAGQRYVRTATAVGRHDTPTPTGSYYVNQRLLSADPSGPFGPGGIGISAFSPVLTGWAQGGPIAIHGTNQPGSIGFAASNGCLRIANDVLERLIHEIPDGTPVHIRA